MKNEGPIKEYKLANGEKRYKFQTYLGINPYTNKKAFTTKRGFKTQREANLELSRLKLNWLDDLKAKYEKMEIKTFEQVYESWLKEYAATVKESTLYKSEQLFNHHILPAFGNKNIKEITPMIVQEQMNAWHKKYVRASMIMNYAGMVFNYAVRIGLIQTNPTKVIRKPTQQKQVKEDKDLNFYDKNELKILMNELEQGANFRAFVFFRLLAFTGMRKGEALALKWTDIDFENKTLNINKAVSRKAAGLYIQTPKTPASIRRISIDDKTLSVLKSFKEQEPTNELIFHTEKDEILSPAKTRKWLVTAQNNVNKERKEPLKKISTHGFRHTHASLLFEAGATIKDVQARLGHSDIQTTMDIYTHVSKYAKEKLAKQFNDYVDF